MPSFTAICITALAASYSVVSAAPAPVRRGQPSTWAVDYLEDYNTYHTRYLALSCQTQHNTTFFESCCHPLLATASLSDRPANCTPTADAVSTATAAAATATTASDDNGAYFSDASSIASVVSEATATASAAEVTLTADGAAATVSVVAAAQTTEAAWTPTSTSTYEAPAATTTAASSGGGGGQYSGEATYFYQGGAAGECGTVHSDSDYVVAIDSAWWSDYESNSSNSNCGRSVYITNTNNGKSVTATIADVCPSCVSSNSLDLSVGAFQAIASESDGMVPISWSFV